MPGAVHGIGVAVRHARQRRAVCQDVAVHIAQGAALHAAVCIYSANSHNMFAAAFCAAGEERQLPPLHGYNQTLVRAVHPMPRSLVHCLALGDQALFSVKRTGRGGIASAGARRRAAR